LNVCEDSYNGNEAVWRENGTVMNFNELHPKNWYRIGNIAEIFYKYRLKYVLYIQ